MSKNSVKAIPLSSFNTTGLTTSFQVIDSAGLDEACFFIRITNDSNIDVIVSFDGVNEAEYVPTLTRFELPSQTNASPAGYVALMQKGQKLYVKGTGDGTGSVYLSGYYTLP